MKILIACDLPDFAREELRPYATEVVYRPDLTPAELGGMLQDVSVLIVGALRVGGEHISAGTSLQMIVRKGTDVSNIAVDEASHAGIFVTHCPHMDGVAAAELTLGLLIALDRRLLERADELRRGRLRPDEPLTAYGLAGRTLGIMDFGPVGREIARRARAFNMHVVAYSQTLTPESARDRGVGYCANPRELARQSHAVAVYAPPGESDQVLIDADFIDSLAEETSVVFIGRPAALDDEALARGIERRRLRVAIDLHGAVGDSARRRSRLLELPGVIGTYQAGQRTLQAEHAMAREAVRIVQRFLATGEVLHCVNLVKHSPATWQLVLRLRDTVGVMAAVMDAVRRDGINAQEISSHVFSGARAVWSAVALDERPSTEALQAIGAIDGVLHLELRAMV